MITDAQVRKLMTEKVETGKIEVAALRSGMSRNTATKYLKGGKLPSELQPLRTWRTRTDIFAEDWPEIEQRPPVSPAGGGLADRLYLGPGAGRHHCRGAVQPSAVSCSAALFQLGMGDGLPVRVAGGVKKRVTRGGISFRPAAGIYRGRGAGQRLEHDLCQTQRLFRALPVDTRKSYERINCTNDH